ncbi:MAG: type II secretion system protein [bacterium]|nr:type II secretion system protein [bacterium]
MKNKKGFTLLEMLITISIIAFTLPALFAIIFVILQQQVKILRLSEVKRQGDNLITSMENTIRTNSTNIYSDSSGLLEICNSVSSSGPPTPTSLYFRNKQSAIFGYNFSSAQPTYFPGTVNLVTSKIIISSPSLSCSRTSLFAPPILKVSFVISYNTTSTRPEDLASLTYQTQFALKNY